VAALGARKDISLARIVGPWTMQGRTLNNTQGRRKAVAARGQSALALVLTHFVALPMPRNDSSFANKKQNTGGNPHKN